MSEANEAIVRRLIEEVFNRGEMGLLTELVAADHVGHDPFGDHYGRDGLRIAVMEYRAAFPDLRLTVDDLVSAHDKVAHRFTLRGTHAGPFMGIPPTARAVTAVGIAIDRLIDGKVAESWVSLDALNLLRQIGVSPVLRRPAGTEPADTASPPSGITARRATRKGDRPDPTRSGSDSDSEASASFGWCRI